MARKLTKKIETIKLEGEFEGWEFTARMNPPMRVFETIASGEFSDMIKGLAEIIISWNFVDEDGLAMPEPSVESLRELALDLAMAVSTSYTKRVSQLPQS